ncbi:MAG: gamma-glutamylcyclotransferase family protein [Clostridia bacterium]|nr:gamma-glutamylcyclotransferase family protein [Clostridia bacterium]
MKRIYMTYDAALGTERMMQICPTARVVGTVELKDYRLLFRGKHGAAVAAVEPLKGSTVPAMLWELSQADEDALDQSVGFPTVYRKEVLTVTLSRKRIKAAAYIMRDGYSLSAPSRYYYGLLLKGYREHGFDEKALATALGASAKEDGPDEPND